MFIIVDLIASISAYLIGIVFFENNENKIHSMLGKEKAWEGRKTPQAQGVSEMPSFKYIF